MDRKSGKQAVNARAGMIAMMQQLARQLQDEAPGVGRLQQENEELVKENAIQKQEIKTLRDHLETLERDASPDAVVARINRRLWHTGDLDLLRGVFLPAKRKRCAAKARVLTLSDRSSTRALEIDIVDRDLEFVLPMQTRSRCSSVGSDRGETSATDAEGESSHAMATRFQSKRRKTVLERLVCKWRFIKAQALILSGHAAVQDPACRQFVLCFKPCNLFLRSCATGVDPVTSRQSSCHRMHSPPLLLSPMERKDRKRKAQEIAESPVLVNEAITELATELAKSDALLRTEISTLKGEVASLHKQLADKTEECVRSQEEVAFLHPDAVIDRVRVKLWHHGDLSLLRKVIDPRPRVLRNTEARSERTLFLCETPTKKASARAQLGGSQTSELSPKREGDEEAAPLAATSPPLSPAANVDAVASEEKSEKTTNSPSMSKIDELTNQPKDVVVKLLMGERQRRSRSQQNCHRYLLSSHSTSVISHLAAEYKKQVVLKVSVVAMGNSPLSREFSGRRVTSEEREAMKRFGDEEMRLLRETFKGLANGKDGVSVDKDTFLKCFPMRGLLGERLFEVIDKDGSGSIHYNEFVYGLAILFRGSRKEKLKFVFDLYDLSEAGSISRHELLTMLHQFPESALDLIKPKTPYEETNNLPETTPGKVMEEIEALVDLAFPAPSSSSTRLSFEQFCLWCENTPGVTNFLMSVLPVEDQTRSNGSLSPHNSNVAPVAPVDGSSVSPGPSSPCPVGHGEPRKKRNSFASLHINRPVSRANAMSSTEHPTRKELEKTRHLLQEAKSSCKIESVTSKIQTALAEVDRLLSQPPGTATSVSRCGSFTSSGESPTPSQALDEIPGAILVEDECSVSGDLWKRGLRLRQMIKRHYVLQGNFLYYYASQDDTAPRGVTFMSDCYVEVQPAQNKIVEKGLHYFGIDIVPEPGSSREKRTVFTRSLESQRRWAAALRRATDKISIEEVYDVGAQLGRGRFSKVCEATHKVSGVKSAVKIIDKSKLQPTEKELLRTEIAILKLVRHPNIIQLHDVYEDRQYIFIVTELVSGGELFNRIVGRARYTEAEARLVMRPLLESVNYLHRLGIVHRDLKPENILCGEALTDLKIADFGLSKLAHPEELMKMPCGTLNYVAPEVLALVGYGREADIWSLGVIMYLLLRGELPFYGKAKSEVIQKTLHAEINLETDSAWRSVSPAGKALLRGLLTKDPARRLTAQDALVHEWFSIKSPRLSITGTVDSGLTALQKDRH